MNRTYDLDLTQVADSLEKMPIGKRVEKLRCYAGMSRSEITTIAQLPFGELANFEQGKCALPMPHAKRIAEAMNIEISTLLGWKIKKELKQAE